MTPGHMRNAGWRSRLAGTSMRDPLIVTLVAVVAGLLAGRALEFSIVDAAWPVAAFLALALVSELRRARLLRQLCLTLALFCAGALSEAWHRPSRLRKKAPSRVT